MNIPRNPIAGPRLLQRSAIVLALAVVATAAHVPAAAQTAAASPASTPKPASRSQPTFESPQAGFEAIVAALRAADAKQLARILGPGHQRIVDSGDTAADRADWARFVASYDAKHSVRLDGDAKVAQLAGDDD